MMDGRGGKGKNQADRPKPSWTPALCTRIVSLANLYDEIAMPLKLRKVHQQNDRAVMQVYEFDVAMTTETSCVTELMRMYQAIGKKAGDI